MKGIKSVFYSLCITAITGYCQLALASGTDPFAAATKKTNELNSDLAGGIAMAVTVLVIIICGFAIMFGKISQRLGLSVIGGALVIGSATTIASFLLG